MAQGRHKDKQMNEAYFQEVLRGGPIPGSSLTADPENPAPFERPLSTQTCMRQVVGYSLRC